MAASVPDVRLNNGVRIPQLGYGVFRVPNEATVHAVRTAIECGYRNIDTAALTATRRGSARRSRPAGFPARRCSSRPSCGTPSRVMKRPSRPSRRACERLGLDYVDLYLIHWPMPAQDRYVDTWRAFERTLRGGPGPRDRRLQLPRRAHLQRLHRETGLVPAVNQVELHPDLQQASCAPGTPSTASPPRPGARSGRAGRSPTRRSPRSPPATAGPRRRSFCAGTSSSATSSSPSRSRRGGSARTSTSSTSSWTTPRWRRSVGSRRERASAPTRTAGTHALVPASPAQVGAGSRTPQLRERSPLPACKIADSELRRDAGVQVSEVVEDASGLDPAADRPRGR